jgi:DNA (cytosine-5)-methyltransferase 1
MTHGSLFSGIGGFDLAAAWMGWENVFHCEWNTFGQQILKYYWPDAKSYTDITKTDFSIHRGSIDILTGGFPCQPYSMAGKRKGKEDNRHLWPEMLRAIKEIQPSWVVGENVHGLINWSGGLVFHEVQTDLEAAGYEVFPYVLPACAVNAPHRRDRVWFIAHRNDTGNSTHGCGDNGNHEKEITEREHPQFEHNGFGTKEFTSDSQSGRHIKSQGIDGREECEQNNRQTIRDTVNSNGSKRDVTNAYSNGQHDGNGKHEINTGEGRKYAQHDIEPVCDPSDTIGIGLEGSIQTGEHEGQRQQIPSGGTISEYLHESRSGVQFENFPTQSPLCGRDDGVSNKLDYSAVWGNIKPREPFITLAKWRTESIKAYGNAIVPQVAYQIFKTIKEYER